MIRIIPAVLALALAVPAARIQAQDVQAQDADARPADPRADHPEARIPVVEALTMLIGIELSEDQVARIDSIEARFRERSLGAVERLERSWGERLDELASMSAEERRAALERWRRLEPEERAARRAELRRDLFGVFSLLRELHEGHRELHEEVGDVLTEEQREQIRERGRDVAEELREWSRAAEEEVEALGRVL